MLLMKRDGSLWALDDVLDQRGKRLGNPAWQMKPVLPRRVELHKEIVAFAGGRKRLGVAVTGNGEVWTWGWALGERNPATTLIQGISRLLTKAGLPNPWRAIRPEPVLHMDPWQLSVEPQ